MKQITNRACTKDFFFDYEGQKFTIEAGKTLRFSNFSFHHDPHYFHEPESFKPERFVDKESFKKVNRIFEKYFHSVSIYFFSTSNRF